MAGIVSYKWCMTNPAKTPRQMLLRVPPLINLNATNQLELSELIYNLAMDVEFHQSLGCESWADFVSTFLQMPLHKAARHIAVWEHFGIRLAGCFNIKRSPPAWSLLTVMLRFTNEQNIRYWWMAADSMSYGEVKEEAARAAAQATGNKGVESVVCHQFNFNVNVKERRNINKAINKVKKAHGFTRNGEALAFIVKEWAYCTNL